MIDLKTSIKSLAASRQQKLNLAGSFKQSQTTAKGQSLDRDPAVSKKKERARLSFAESKKQPPVAVIELFDDRSQQAPVVVA